MSDLKIISETPLSLTDVKDIITKKKKDITGVAAKTIAYIDSVLQTKEKKAKEMEENLNKLTIQRLKDRHIKKIVDIMPKDMDSLKIIFTGESITVKQEDLQKILEVIKAG